MARVRPSDSAHHMFGDSCGKRDNLRAHEFPRGFMTTVDAAWSNFRHRIAASGVRFLTGHKSRSA